MNAGYDERTLYEGMFVNQTGALCACGQLGQVRVIAADVCAPKPGLKGVEWPPRAEWKCDAWYGATVGVLFSPASFVLAPQH